MTTILLIEDLPEIRAVLSSILADRGHSVVAVPDREAAHHRLAHTEFDLIIDDVIASAAEDREGLTRLNGRSCLAPVIAITGQQEGTPNPGWAQVERPFDCADLIELVERMLPGCKGQSDQLAAVKSGQSVPPSLC